MHLLRQQFFWLGWLTVLAFVVGFLYLAPSLLIKSAIERSGGFYLLPQVVHPTHSDSVVWYVPAAREVADGHFLPSDLHVPENKNLPFFLPPLPLILFGSLIAFFGDPNAAYLAALFIFPALTFLLFYWLARQFFNSHLGGVAFGAIGAFTPVALHYLGRIDETFQFTPGITLKSFIPFVRTPIPELYLSRITEPLLTIPFLILAFGLLWRFWREPSGRRGALAAIAIALTLYVYLHYFAFLVGFAAILCLLNFTLGERRNLREWLLFSGVIALGVLPFIFNYLELRSLPQFGDWLGRWSGAFEQWRGLRLSAWKDYLLYAALAVPLIFLWRRNKKMAVFFAAALLTMLISWNVQIATGFTIIPTHWRKAFGVPLYALVAVYFAEAAVYVQAHPRLRISRRVIASILLILLLLLVVKRTMNVAAYIYPDARTMRDFSFPVEIYKSWQWLDKNVPAESVVISPSWVTSLYLTGYTSMNPYLPFAEATLAPRVEVEERFLNVYKIFGVPEERVRILLHGKYYQPTACDELGACGDEHSSRNLLRTPQMLYGATFDTRQLEQDQLTLAYDQLIPLAVIDELVKRYNIVNPRWQDFSGYYVYYGPWERQIHELDLKIIPNLEFLYDKSGIEIYRVK